MAERRPYWLFLFALPLCCGASLISLAVGAGGAGAIGSMLLGGTLGGPLAALGFGSLFGASLAVPLIAVAARRTHTHDGGCREQCIAAGAR